MRHHLGQAQHIGVFVVQIEQVDLMDQRRPIKRVFLHHNNMIAAGTPIHAARPHAARGAFAADDQAAHGDMGQEGRDTETALDRTQKHRHNRRGGNLGLYF